jgi:hypothetical protein
LALLALLAVLALAGGGCGLGLEWPGIVDDTCYDCRTVCQGTVDDTRDECLAACHECQGRSACFAWLDGQFEGQELMLDEWEVVDCDAVD